MTNTINTIATVNNGAINDHNGRVIKLAGVCMLNNGEVGALLDTKRYYCINELYKAEDGTAHVSTKSISGTVSPDMDLSTPEGIQKFNDTITFDSHKIAKVVLIKVVNA